MHRLICESLGPVQLGMALTWDGECLRYTTRRWSFLGIPMPAFMAPRGDVSEFVEQGRFNFHVDVHMPVAGHIVTYKGWLEPHA